MAGDSTETLDRTSRFLDKRIGDTLGLVFRCSCFADSTRLGSQQERSINAAYNPRPYKTSGLYRDCSGRRGRIEPGSFGRGSFDCRRVRHARASDA